MSFNPTSTAQSGDDMDITLFERYCAGDATPAQRTAIEAWLMNHPEQREWYETVSATLVQGDAPRVTDAQQERRLATILRHTRNTEFTEGQNQRLDNGLPAVRHIPRYVPWLAYLGGAVALVIAGWVGGAHQSSRLFDVESVSTYTTSNGQRATIVLPDSTIASLNVGSRLEVPVGYGPKNRTVHLTGEAMFSVVSRPGSPLTVTTVRSTIRVLGTMFRVQEYRSDSATIVAVRDGKVSVSSLTGASTVLTAAQEVSVMPSRVLQVRDADFSKFSFADGLLTFNGTTLRDAIPALNRWYDAEIQLGDPVLASSRIKGSFASGSLTDLSTILEWTYGVQVVRNGRVLTLYPK